MRGGQIDFDLTLRIFMIAGTLIYNFIKQRGQTNTVCTLYELTEGSEAVGQPFHGLDEAVLLRSLQTLELQKKAEIFPGGEGVKFF